MPKVIAKYNVTAKHEPLCLAERISPSLAICTKYKDVGARRPVPKPVHVKPIPRPMSRAEYIESEIERIEEQERNALLRRLYAEKRKEVSLAKRIATPPPPLIERIAHVYEPPAPIPKKLHFRQKKITSRIDKIRPNFDAVK